MGRLVQISRRRGRVEGVLNSKGREVQGSRIRRFVFGGRVVLGGEFVGSRSREAEDSESRGRWFHRGVTGPRSRGGLVDEGWSGRGQETSGGQTVEGWKGGRSRSQRSRSQRSRKQGYEEASKSPEAEVVRTRGGVEGSSWVGVFVRLAGSSSVVGSLGPGVVRLRGS